MKQVTCEMLFRGLGGLSMDAPAWNVPVFIEPGVPAGRRRRRGVPAGDHGQPGSEAAPVGRATLHRQHTDRRLGLGEELAERKDGGADDPAGPGCNAERACGASDRRQKRCATPRDQCRRL